MNSQSGGTAMKSLGAGGLLILFASMGWATTHAADYATEPLDQIKAQVEGKKAVLVDVREKSEWEEGHVEGAIFLPLSRLMVWERDGVKPEDRAWIEKSLPKGKPVYCHCAAGGRAVPASEILDGLGVSAKPLKPGYRDLLQAGFSKATK